MANKLAVVTGASSGIGYNLAKVFAENGYDLVIGAEDAGIEKAAGDFKALGVHVTAQKTDLATPDGCKKFWAGVEALDRKIDAVAINAGIGVGGLFVDTDLEKELNLVRVNVESTVHIAKYAARKLVAQKDGKILITSSIAAEMVAPKEAVYAASKAFDLSFAKRPALRTEGHRRERDGAAARAGGHQLLRAGGTWVEPRWVSTVSTIPNPTTWPSRALRHSWPAMSTFMRQA